MYGSLRASALLEKSMDKSEAKMAKQTPEKEFHGLFKLQSEVKLPLLLLDLFYTG